MGLVVNKDLANTLLDITIAKMREHIDKYGLEQKELKDEDGRELGRQTIGAYMQNDNMVLEFGLGHYRSYQHDEIMKIIYHKSQGAIEYKIDKCTDKAYGTYKASSYILPGDSVVKKFKKFFKYMKKQQDKSEEIAKQVQEREMASIFEDKINKMYPEIIDEILVGQKND